uniref:DUF4212 domain-containing protein n=1 Tax=Thermorudis peleae TaxID=1382356 RepID=A0A831X9Q1_9BACT
MEDQRSQAEQSRIAAYWRENWRLIIILLTIWFIVSYLHPPFAKALNDIHILTGFPLGYWLSSQGAITVYVILIFTYALRMNRVIDKKYGFDEEE